MNLANERPFTFEEESVADLVKDLRDETINMVRQQVELAKTETSEKISVYSKNFSSVAIGAGVLYAGLLFLLGAFTFAEYAIFIALGLTPFVSLWLAPLITGVMVSLIGWSMVSSSMRKIKQTSILPDKLVHSIKEDRQWIRRKL
jgi:VIT1/CCC1 family predicted Fe2+/Mn2+ transporter